MKKRTGVKILFITLIPLLAVAALMVFARQQATEAAPPAQPTSIPAAWPIDPPDASKISVSEPNPEGYATVTGAAGAVQPSAYVLVVNLDARTVITDIAGLNGSFSANLYAPPGSSLLVKYEPEPGTRIKAFWEKAKTSIADATTENANPLPGTIIYVGQPELEQEDNQQPFYSVGAMIGRDPRGWAGWWISATLQLPADGGRPGLNIQPGQPMTITGRLRITSPAIHCTGTPTYTVGTGNIFLRSIFDAQGRPEPWGMWFDTFLFTPTGLPIEHEANGETRDTGSAMVTSSPTCVSEHAFELGIRSSFTVPADLPEGIYRPESWIVGTTAPLGSGVAVAAIWYRTAEVMFGLPTFTVGQAEPPRIPFTILGNYAIDGQRGALAMENAGNYQMVTRVRYPTRRVVIPRLDERSGEPLVYTLEPESNWLSATDRRLPPSPHIPLALPSGTLVVEVTRPDKQVDTLGPAPIRQSWVRTPTLPGGSDLAEGTGQIGDLFHLTTMNEAFAYRFEQYGPHAILVTGEVDDIYGNTYPIHSTFEVFVARVLDLDPAQLPTTPYMVGDAFAPGVHIYPPVPADVSVSLIHIPYSEPPPVIISAVIEGKANRFGIFQPAWWSEMRLEVPGEFRVDITAEYWAPDGTLWAGAVTWGNVVEGAGSRIEAHGRRGMDYKSDTIDDMPAWFINANLPTEKFGIENYYPYFSGDIHWGDETPERASKGDSIHSIITLKDLTGPDEAIYDLLRSYWNRATNAYRWPPVEISPAGLEKRMHIGEAPLFITTRSGVDPAVNPADIDLWGYWYGSSERPDVHVREIISEDGMGTAYWRFNDTYGYQIGEPADGDQPGDIKWEFGGIVLRTVTDTNPIHEYAIYSSLWVLLPHNDPQGARVTPPFQDALGLLNGGPIMTLNGQEIDMLFLPKGVRPGDVLEVGRVVSFSGHVGPPLDSRVDVTITAPSGAQHSGTWHANKIGWLYEPGFEFVADEPGRWTVDVSVVHDRPYRPTGTTPLSHNTGTVLGTQGRYEFYVVEPGSPWLPILAPKPGFLTWPTGNIEPIPIRGIAPPGTTVVYYTIHDKGVVMGQGSVVPGPRGAFTILYDPVALHTLFPMLSLTAHEGRWQGLSDEVEINLLAVGGDMARANTVTLIGEEVFVGSFTHSGYIPMMRR